MRSHVNPSEWTADHDGGITRPRTLAFLRDAIGLAALVASLVVGGCRGGGQPSSTSSAGDADEPATLREVVAGCNAATLSRQAIEVERTRAAWTPASGRPLSRERHVVALLRDACAPDVLAPFERVLHTVEGNRTIFGVYAAPGDGTKLVCPEIDDVAVGASRLPWDERSAFVYDGCKLDRFVSIVTRDEFLAAGATTGGASFIALAMALQAASVPAPTSEPLVRELVLASGRGPRLPEGVELPRAATGGRPAEGYTVVVTPSTMYGGHTFTPPRPIDGGPEALLDPLMAVRDEDTPRASDPVFVLAADKRLPARRVREVVDVFARAGTPAPLLLVLVDDPASPVRAIPLPTGLATATGSLADLLAPSSNP